MEIKFIKRTTIIGNSRAVLIPKAIADLLDSADKYEFTIKEVSEIGDKTDSC